MTSALCATDFDSLLRRTRQCSRYVHRLLDAEPPLLDWLREHYATPCHAAEMAVWLDELAPQTEAALSRALRQLRKRVMLKIVLRDLNGLADLNEVMRCMTALAELVVQRAQAAAMQSLCALYGVPIGSESRIQQALQVVGMGKLGGGELNASSDIDLIFVYAEEGETDGARRLSNHEFFTRLGKKIIQAINELTADGYVFRVDMRLRPYGDSGALVLSFAALEEYLVAQGREWERYAWIKARVISPLAQEPQPSNSSVPPSLPPLRGKARMGVDSLKNRTAVDLPISTPTLTLPLQGGGNTTNAGNREFPPTLTLPLQGGGNSDVTDELFQLVRPFVFRKYLDFGAFESMRKLHAQIRQEVLRRDRANNIKLGPGGIREVEFIAQVFQLIYGGRNAKLRIRPTQRVLQQLAADGQLSQTSVHALNEAYIFLRNLEHRLQYLDDQQTQDLPDNADDQALLALGMGYADYAALLIQLNQHRCVVSLHFEQIFSTGKAAAEDSPLWREGLPVEVLREALGELGYTEAQALAERLLQIQGSARYRQLPELSRQRFDTLLPQLITLCATSLNRAQTLSRLLQLLESISRRASYLAFLAEYPDVLPRLVKLADASAWAGEFLIQHPILLDELLDTREIYRAPDWDALDASLDTDLGECGQDIEQQMDVLRQFQHSQTFHLLAMDLQGLLPLEILSDHLSRLADLILQHVLQLCWRDARKKHQTQAQFAIIAYGKLGGRELGYASDLDLIFLYDDEHPDAGEIYARLAQRINTVLSSYTAAGRLYETDLRLRPNGASGLLVSSVEAFAEYQQREAWVWEHQALTRARFCAGDTAVGARFEAIRSEVLCQPRKLATLRGEIAAMRQKMHDGHANPSNLFDIKHDAGGMVDIEFMVQFLVLAYSAAHPELSLDCGNLKLLKLAAELGLVDAELSLKVQQSYRTLRRLQHQLRLNNIVPSRVEQGTLDTAAVLELWGQLLLNEELGESDLK